MTKFDFSIHTYYVLIHWNKILDILQCGDENLNIEVAVKEMICMSNTVEQVEIEFRSLELGGDGSAFWTLNEQWISHYFVMEPKDIETLSDPENTILRKGGKVFFVYAADAPVGCVALIPIGDGIYELSKMAVSPTMRGQGIGRKLIEYAIEQSRELGAKGLFLGSNSVLKNAVHLYESVGFKHVPKERLPDMHYARADVFMEMPLTNSAA
jgi:N-acetylglutamate synthase-like GNAT family acetyltransferase